MLIVTTLPKDPMILLSYVNTQLRDNYDSLGEMCHALGVEESEIVAALSAVGYRYEPARNRFC